MTAPKLRSLEMLRAFAALLVVFYHTQAIFGTRTGSTPFSGLFDGGFRGVDLFFVLSGFIIAHVHASDVGRPWRLGNYLFNRAARIYPAVWIMTAFAMVLYLVGFGGDAKASKLGAWSVTASALLLPQAGDALVNVTWTLKCELFFYLVFAVMVFDRRMGLTVLFTWQLAVLTASIWLPTEALGLAVPILRSLCLDFGVGLACAWLIGRRPFVDALQGRMGQSSLCVVGLAAFVVGMRGGTEMPYAGVLCAVGAGAGIVGLVLMEQSDRLRIPDFLVRLGGASYAIYLVHFSAITLLAVVAVHAQIIPMNDAVFLTGAAIGVAGGIAFDTWIDKPVQRLLRRRLRPMLIAAAQPVQSLSL